VSIREVTTHIDEHSDQIRYMHDRQTNESGHVNRRNGFMISCYGVKGYQGNVLLPFPELSDLESSVLVPVGHSKNSVENKGSLPKSTS
jgi:hypothetical protein